MTDQKKLKSAEHALLRGTDTYQKWHLPLTLGEKNNVDELEKALLKSKHGGEEEPLNLIMRERKVDELEKAMKDCETLADKARRCLIAQNVQTDMFNLTDNLFDMLKLTDDLTKLYLTSLIGKE